MIEDNPGSVPSHVRRKIGLPLTNWKLDITQRKLFPLFFINLECPRDFISTAHPQQTRTREVHGYWKKWIVFPYNRMQLDTTHTYWHFCFVFPQNQDQRWSTYHLHIRI